MEGGGGCDERSSCWNHFRLSSVSKWCFYVCKTCELLICGLCAIAATVAGGGEMHHGIPSCPKFKHLAVCVFGLATVFGRRLTHVRGRKGKADDHLRESMN